MSSIDLYLSPTLAKPPLVIGTLKGDQKPFDLDQHLNSLFEFSPMTSLFNLSGQPAMSIPFGHSSKGLPIGVQLAANHWKEILLLQVAAQIEEEKPWMHNFPVRQK